MDSLWSTHGPHMVHTWCTYGPHMVHTCSTHGPHDGPHDGLRPTCPSCGNNCMQRNESKDKLDRLGIKNVQDLLRHVAKSKPGARCREQSGALSKGALTSFINKELGLAAWDDEGIPGKGKNSGGQGEPRLCGTLSATPWPTQLGSLHCSV